MNRQRVNKNEGKSIFGSGALCLLWVLSDVELSTPRFDFLYSIYLLLPAHPLPCTRCICFFLGNTYQERRLIAKIRYELRISRGASLVFSKEIVVDWFGSQTTSGYTYDKLVEIKLTGLDMTSPTDNIGKGFPAPCRRRVTYLAKQCDIVLLSGVQISY